MHLSVFNFWKVVTSTDLEIIPHNTFESMKLYWAGLSLIENLLCWDWWFYLLQVEILCMWHEQFGGMTDEKRYIYIYMKKWKKKDFCERHKYHSLYARRKQIMGEIHLVIEHIIMISEHFNSILNTPKPLECCQWPFWYTCDQYKLTSRVTVTQKMMLKKSF